MAKFIIQGGRPLVGTMPIAGAKNSALPILIAALLTNEPLVIENVPELEDINTTLDVLHFMGVSAKVSEENSHTVLLDASQIRSQVAPYDLVRTMRASILALGPLLAKHGQATVSLPGGCAIGSRPVDLHLKGLEAMGAQIDIHKGYIHAKSQGRLKGTHFIFDKTTVNGTQNLLMAATLAEGKTTLENTAREPEVSDLADLLIKMGAKIHGAGSDTIEIEGVESLHGTTHRIIPDRIEAATYLMAAMITKGDLTLTETQVKPLEILLSKLKEMGARIEILSDTSVHITCTQRPQAIDITTAPYPGFPTDMQAQFMALTTIAEGHSSITETIFENRFMHVQELERMGALIKLQGHTALVTGVENLTGAPVMATDLRASAGLVLAALVAQGETIIDRIYHIDRGYEHIEVKLRALGAKIERVTGDTA